MRVLRNRLIAAGQPNGHIAGRDSSGLQPQLTGRKIAHIPAAPPAPRGYPRDGETN